MVQRAQNANLDKNMFMERAIPRLSLGVHDLMRIRTYTLGLCRKPC